MKHSPLVPLVSTVFLGIVLAAVSVFLPSCSQGSSWTRTVDWKDLDLHALPGTKEYPDAGAIVLRDEGTMEIIGSGELRTSIFERHRIIKVLSAAGQRYANVVIQYGTGTDVDNIQARTIAPDGTITPVEERDIFDVSLYPNYIFFSDQRARLFTFPAVENGSVLEYRYRLRMAGHMFWHSWSFQDRAPTLISRFTLMSPAEYPVTAKLYGISIVPQGAKMPAGFKQSTIWEARDIPPLPVEFGMPAEREVEARLAIAPLGFGTWDDVAKWYDDLAHPRESIGPRIKALVARLTSGATDDRAKLRRIFEWVQQQVRYMAVEIGIGGFQPHAAEEVCTKQYGDCKDMTTLLCSMAQQAGIDVRQVLVSTWQNGIPDTTFCSPLQFNHAIAFAPSIDGGLWMDATEKWCRFGELPWYDQGLPVLLVEGNGTGSIITTPRVPSAGNRSADQWDVRLDSTGGAIVQGISLFAGSQAVELRNDISDVNPSDRRRWVESYLARRCPGAMLDSLQFTGLQPDGDTLKMYYRMHTSMFAVRQGSALVIHPGWLSASGLSEYFRSPSRVFPIRFRFGNTSESLLNLHLPEGWSMVMPELPDSLQGPFGSARWTCQAEGPLLTWRSDYSFRGNDIAPARFSEFRGFLDAMQAGDMREIEVGRRVQAGKPGEAKPDSPAR
jgi:hypothetical protein